MARRTNSKEIKELVRKYILECLDFTGEEETEAERLNAFIRQCEEVGKNGILPNGNYRMLGWQNAVNDTVFGCYGAFEVGTWAICEIVAGWTDTNADDFDTEKNRAVIYLLNRKRNGIFSKEK